MPTLSLAASFAVLCLVVLPALLRSTTRFDRAPLAGLVVWGAMCLVGWLSTVVAFLKLGLGGTDAPTLRALGLFVAHLGDGHPLRGLGLSEVVGLSVAFDIAVLTLGGLVVTSVRVAGARSQRRTLVDLVAEAPDSLAGVCLLRHSCPMAYYLPGDGGRVVLSTGAVDALSQAELDAVIAHEYGHRRGRHGAVLIPLQVLSSFVVFIPLARYGPTTMRTYLEMIADDYARARASADGLKTALAKAVLFHPAPMGALSFDGVIDRRINRLAAAPVSTRNARSMLVGASTVSALIIFVLLTAKG